jgi:hypothetical protein
MEEKRMLGSTLLNADGDAESDNRRWAAVPVDDGAERDDDDGSEDRSCDGSGKCEFVRGTGRRVSVVRLSAEKGSPPEPGNCCWPC